MNNLLLVLVVMVTLMVDIQGAPGVYGPKQYVVKLANQMEVVPNGGHVLLQPTGRSQLVLVPAAPTVKKHHGEGEAEEYDEGTEESRDWKEEDKDNDAEEKEEKDDDDGKYKGSYSEKDDPDEKGEEDLDEPTEPYDKADEESEKLETKEEEEMHSEKGEEEDEAEEEEDPEEANEKKEESHEEREGKSDGNNESGQYYTISLSSQVAHKLSQSAKKRNAPIVTLETIKEKVRHHEVPAFDKTEKHEKDSAAIHPTKKGHSNSNTAPEVVIGSRDKAQIEVSNSQAISSGDSSKTGKEKETTSDTKLNPSAKETEIVQLSPVIFHVSPKLVPHVAVPIPGRPK